MITNTARSRERSQVRATIQETPAHRLDVSLERGAYGTHLMLITFVPTARNPEEQVKFQTTLSDTELRNFEKVLSAAVASATI